MENGPGLAITVPQPRAIAALEFTPDQQKMIRDSFASGASPQEFAVLMEIAKARRLNPLLRQIYFVKRWDSVKRCEVWSTQISIDGLRAVAERTGMYAGQDEPEYVYEEASDKLSCCKVRVYRKDWPRPAVGVAYFAEYAQTKKDGTYTSFWATKPHIMLAKCAEALAIRKAFPEDTGGLYVAEEMGAEAAAADPAPVGHLPKREPEVIPTPDPQDEVTARNNAAQLAAAAEVLQGEVMADPTKIKLFWKKATAPEHGNMTPTMFEKFVEEHLGVLKRSKDWTATDLAKLEDAYAATQRIDF